MRATMFVARRRADGRVAEVRWRCSASGRYGTVSSKGTSDSSSFTVAKIGDVRATWTTLGSSSPLRVNRCDLGGSWWLYGYHEPPRFTSRAGDQPKVKTYACAPGRSNSI